MRGSEKSLKHRLGASVRVTIIRSHRLMLQAAPMKKGTREIRVILYAKDDPFCATALADELSIEDILAVEHDIVPIRLGCVFQQGEIDSIGERVALTRRHLSSCTKSSSVRVAAR